MRFSSLVTGNTCFSSSFTEKHVFFFLIYRNHVFFPYLLETSVFLPHLQKNTCFSSSFTVNACFSFLLTGKTWFFNPEFNKQNHLYRFYIRVYLQSIFRCGELRPTVLEMRAIVQHCAKLRGIAWSLRGSQVKSTCVGNPSFIVFLI